MTGGDSWKQRFLAPDLDAAEAILVRHGVVVLDLRLLYGDRVDEVRRSIVGAMGERLDALFRDRGVPGVPGFVELLATGATGRGSAWLRERWGKEAFETAMYRGGDRGRSNDTRHPALSNTTGLTPVAGFYDIPAHRQLQRDMRPWYDRLYTATVRAFGAAAMGLPADADADGGVGTYMHWERTGIKLAGSTDMGTHVDMAAPHLCHTHGSRPAACGKDTPQSYHRVRRIQTVVPVTASGGTFRCVTGCHTEAGWQNLVRLTEEHQGGARTRIRHTGPFGLAKEVVAGLRAIRTTAGDAPHEEVTFTDLPPMHAVLWYCSLPHCNTAVPRRGELSAARAAVYVNYLPVLRSDAAAGGEASRIIGLGNFGADPPKPKAEPTEGGDEDAAVPRVIGMLGNSGADPSKPKAEPTEDEDAAGATVVKPEPVDERVEALPSGDDGDLAFVLASIPDPVLRRAVALLAARSVPVVVQGAAMDRVLVDVGGDDEEREVSQPGAKRRRLVVMTME